MNKGCRNKATQNDGGGRNKSGSVGGGGAPKAPPLYLHSFVSMEGLKIHVKWRKFESVSHTPYTPPGTVETGICREGAGHDSSLAPL
ncbi:hypothetical protein ACFX12_032907 [Malus domestica]